MRKQFKQYSSYLLALTIAILGITDAQGQQVPLYGQYYYAPSLAYPSSSVFKQDRYVSLMFRDQFGGLVGSPKNFAMAYNGTVRGRSAFSANITTTDIGFTSQVKMSAGFGYKLFGEGNDGLAIGGQMGLSLFSLNEDRVNPENPVDNALSDLLGQNGSVIGLDLSLSYRMKQLSIDISVPTIINVSLSDDAYVQINEDNVPDFIGGASYEFILNQDLNFKPYLGVRIRKTIGAELDVMGELTYKEKFKLLGGYRDNYGASVGIGLQVFPNMLFTYNYDIGQKNVPFLADGFNEFGLHFKLKDRKKAADECIEMGQVVVNKIIDQKIYDENLVSLEDKKAALCYFNSLEEGKKKEKKSRSEAAYLALFEKVKQEVLEEKEMARQAGLAQARQDSIQIVREAEIEALRIEAYRAQAIEAARVLKMEEDFKEALSLATSSVSFRSSQAVLRNESFASLDQVVELLLANPTIKLALAGYTDNVGDAEVNLKLSIKRTLAVKAYMVSKGVPSEQITSEGHGEENPISSNSTSEGRALNRRVEMKIIEN